MRFLSAVALGVALSCSTLMAAQPSDPTTASIFAGRNLTFNLYNTVTGGPVVANGNVVHNGGILELPSLYAGGSLSCISGSYQTTHGDLQLGGDITNIGGPGHILGGNVTSGGSISFLATSQTVTGNVTAVGNVSQPSGLGTVNGNVTAGGNANIGGTVGGVVTYGGALTQGPFTSIGGGVVHGGSVTVPAYVPLTLPAGRALTAGTTNISLAQLQTRSIAPGVYGALTFATGNVVKLTAGQYVFSSITSSFVLNKLDFDTSAGPINIYVAGDFNFHMVQVINGEPLTSGGVPDPADARDIFIEVAGSYTGGSSIFGTIFAPNGDITLSTFAMVTGQVLAGRDVTLNSSGVYTVPEPASLSVMGACGLMLLRRRRRES